jgi:adenosylhomocysteine nucleosidase
MKIGVIGAMFEEVELLRDKMTNIKDEYFANQSFAIGEIENHEVILLNCGIGKVSAAIGTTLLIDKFAPNYIINTGVAGAMGSLFSIGDIIISSEIGYHDVDLTVFGYKIGQMSKMPPTFLPDKDLINIAEKCIERLTHAPIKKALILSGDSFINWPSQVSYIKKHFPADCVIEMEASAIAQVCHVFNVPFIIIRSISDIIEDEHNKIAYEKFLILAAQKSADFVLQMLKELNLHLLTPVAY